MIPGFIRRMRTPRRQAVLAATDIVNGYVWLLGRRPSPGEIRASLAHFETQGGAALHAFQNSLIVSEEFRLRRIHVTQSMRGEPVDLLRRKIVFLHVEKCGGTSLRNALASQIPPGRVCPEQFNGLGDWTANELATYDLFAGHFDLAVCSVVPGPCSIVTMLREPKARLLSLFNFWKAHRPHPSFSERTLVGLAQRHTAMEFFSHQSVVQHPSIRDAIVGQLTRRIPSPILPDGFQRLQPADAILADPAGTLGAAWRALTGLAGFGLVESFEQSRVLLNRRLGLRMESAIPHQMLQTLVSPMLDEHRQPPERLTPPLDMLLDALTPLDQALHTRASALFQQRVAMLG